MKNKFDVYGKKNGEWFYVDAFLTREAAIDGINRMFRRIVFASYTEYEIRERFFWDMSVTLR